MVIFIDEPNITTKKNVVIILLIYIYIYISKKIEGNLKTFKG